MAAEDVKEQTVGPNADDEKAEGPVTPRPWLVDMAQLQLHEVIAGSSSGLVRRGTYRGEPAAVKMLAPQTGASPRTVLAVKQDFHQKANSWFKLQHPNVVKFIGAFVRPPSWMIVCEYMEGGSLGSFLHQQQGKPLSSQKIAAIAAGVCHGMAYLHAQGLVLGNLTSSNILLAPDRQAKVSPFNLEHLEAPDLSANAEAVCWMAPEVLDHRQYTRKTDVYSFAIILWQLCTLKKPYENRPLLQLARAVVAEGLRPPVDGLPPALARVMSRCWSADHTERPEFGELAKELLQLGKEPQPMGSSQEASGTSQPADLRCSPQLASPRVLCF